MVKKIVVMDESTGVLHEIDASNQIADLLKIAKSGSLDAIASQIHSLLKGVSVAKITEILAIVAANGNGFFEAIKDIRENGESEVRLVISRVPVQRFNPDEKPEAPVEGAIADQLREAGYDVKEDADGNQEIEAPADAEPDQETDNAETPENEGDAADDQEPTKSDEPEAENEPDSDEATPEQEVEQETALDPDKADPYEAGQQARVEGLGPDDNPHDGGAEDGNAWAEGYTDADGEIDQLKQQGYDARKDGLAPDRNPWKAKTRENAWWAEGYDKAKAEGLPEE